MNLAVAATLAALATLAGSLFWLARVVSRMIDRPAPVSDQSAIRKVVLELAAEVDRNRVAIGDLKLAVAEGVQHVLRAENRVKKTVTNAKKKLAAHGVVHEGLDAEAEELAERDGEAGAEPELPLVLENVEDHRPTGVPGITRAHLEAIAMRRFS